MIRELKYSRQSSFCKLHRPQVTSNDAFKHISITFQSLATEMLVISFGEGFWGVKGRREQSVVRLREICFPFASQVGETKPYGKNVSQYDNSICVQFREIDWRVNMK